MYNYDVIQVIPTDNFEVYVYFSDGKIKLFNANELVKKGVFKQLEDINIFKSTCTVLNGKLAWDLDGTRNEWKCLDIDTENLYNSCPTVKEPVYLFKSYNQ